MSSNYDYDDDGASRTTWSERVRDSKETKKEASLLSEILTLGSLFTVGAGIFYLAHCRPIIEATKSHSQENMTPAEKIINSKDNPDQLDKNTLVGR